MILGFALGVAAKFGVRRLSERLTPEKGGAQRPAGLMMAVGVDIFVDWLLVGVGFAAGAKTRALLMIALTVELLFLALSTVAAQVRTSVAQRTVALTSASFTLLVALSARLGVTLLARLAGPALEVVLSFGAAALLRLVTEGLLVEAHEVPATPLATASFFIGFLELFLIEMVSTSERRWRPHAAVSGAAVCAGAPARPRPAPRQPPGRAAGSCG